ncbi:Ig-like domain-containing protein [Bifidobacterium pseudolongum]|uniref:Bacterial Ig-like domain (Group 2) n=1 Tax=Bifidobacterium pseudolongum subsp. globosum TaxID=1690 RepID=A0A2N3R416_9BIFI|nr:Ig-like domain-containing protein [Bifidobacterium pseudolongum]PKV02771.1 Bacterial Ig-like domain (group 2) [Bifidobacterium pseudolongum subsp. globosum]
MSIVDRIHGIQKKVAAGAIAAATLIAGMGLAAPAYAADFTLVGPDTVPSSDKFQITALGLPADVATDDITWETSQWRNAMQSIWPQNQGNTSTWDADMTPYEDGMVTISATYQGQTAEKTVKVEKRSYQYLAGFDLTADGLEGSDGEYTLHIPSGGTVETSTTFNPENATYQHLIWQSMDPSVVRGGADGVIRAVNNGTADLVAYSYGKIHKKTIHVTVGGDAPVNIPVESVSINGGDATMQTGETKTLSATVLPSNATNKKVTWSSSDEKIATVDSKGNIKANKAGTATIKATAGGKSASVTVTVEEAPPAPYASVKIDGGDFSVKAGETHQLTAKLLAADGTEVTSDDALTWRSSNTAIASVDANGLVTGVAKGTANITVTVGDKSDTVAATVTEDEPVANSTTIYYPSSKYGANSTYLHWRFANGTWTTAPGDKMSAACDGYVSFTIANPDAKDIEFVFNNGSGQWDNKGGTSGQNYMASGETVVITDNSGNYSTVAPCVVTIPVETVSIAGGDVELKEGASKQLVATVSPSNATNRSVSWKSSNTSVATVDASGKVTAVAAGSATVTATAGGKSASVKVTVASDYVAVSSVSVSPSRLDLQRGGSGQLSATVAPSDASDRAVSWRSSNPAVASVDANGRVTALKAGVASVTATAGGVVSPAVEVTVKAAPRGDTLGIRRGTEYHFRYSLSTGPADKTVRMGMSNDVALVGDWDGDGKDTLMLRRGNMNYVYNDLDGKTLARSFQYGAAGDVVLVGDWDGDGKDTLAIRRGNAFHIRNSLTTGPADRVVNYGLATDQILVGDWDGDGKDTLMVRRGNENHVRNSLTTGKADRIFNYGLASDRILVGDWDADGKDTLMVRRGNENHVRNSLTTGKADRIFNYGLATDTVLVGNWTGR